MSQNIDYENLDLEAIDFDKIDYSDTDFLLPLVQKSPKPALTVFPIEIWIQIVSYVNDIQTLKSLILTCSVLREILKEPLITQMVNCEPLNKLFELTKECIGKEKNDDKEIQKLDIKEIVLKMHKYVDKVVYSESGPSKWTDDIFEWDGYNEKLDLSANQEAFRREVGRKGKARARAYIEWELKVENEKKVLKRELAKCWAVTGKMFPFRPNVGKGEEEYNKRVLTPFVTPMHFNNGASFEGLPHDVMTNVMIKILKRFFGSNEKVLKFPCDLSGYQRKRLHRQAELLGGLKTISFGE
ncbi:13464_t:CDS:2, partial [Racocetra fulgida]